MGAAEDIVKSGWAQYGALFLLAIIGWLVSWKLWKEYLAIRESQFVLLRQTIEANAALKATLDHITDMLDDLVVLMKEVKIAADRLPRRR